MSQRDLIKALLAVAGVGVWGYGLRIGSTRLQGAGLALVVVAFALRLLARSRRTPR